MKTKLEKLTEVMKNITDLTTLIEEDEANDTPENNEQYKALHAEAMELKESIRIDTEIKGVAEFLKAPAHESKAYGNNGDGVISQPFTGIKSLGEQFVESKAYQDAFSSRTPGNIRAGGANMGLEAKGFLFPAGQKATFTTTAGGLDSTVNYVMPPGGGVVLVEQQRLTVRDLLSVGQTTMNSIPYIAETSFTNAADMVAEEGEKPEATLATEDRTAPVKKIAVVLKVTDEMFSDFPVLRDYINSRLRFMVLAKEEQQLLHGTGVGNQITGIVQTSGIQTQALGGDTVLDAIYKGITKIRSVGFYEPDGLVMHPNDYETIRLAKDSVGGQYYGGGPFTGAYGNGAFIENPGVWGLRTVVTTAMTENTALLGAFKLGAQIWQREGVSVDSTNSNEDDFNFNRVTLRVEERLALAVYRPKAFCTVTGI